MNLKSINNCNYYQMLLEVVASQHSYERASDRILNSNIPQRYKESVKYFINHLSKKNMPKHISYGIRIARINVDPNDSNTMIYKTKRGKEVPIYNIKARDGKYSQGNEIWAIVRNNVLHTIMLVINPMKNRDLFMKIMRDKLNVDETFVYTGRL